MKFYVFNRSDSANIGDQLIGEIINKTLYSEGHTIIKNKVYRRANGRIRLLFLHLLSYLSDVRILLQVDSLIIGGGNLVMDVTGIGWAVHQFWLSFLCLLFRRDYFYLCVGVNPLQHSISRKLYRFAINHAKKVSVRDSGSKEQLRRLTSRSDIVIIPDPVLMVSRFYPVQTERHNVIGICPIQFKKVVKHSPLSQTLHDSYVDLHVKLANYVISEGYTVQIFVNDPDVDQITADEIVQRLSSNSEQIIYKPTPTERTEYLKLISSLTFLVTSRMHAAICAISYSVPCIGLGWQPKMKHLFQDLETDGYINIITLLSEKTSDQALLQLIKMFHCGQHVHPKLVLTQRTIIDFLIN